MASRRRPRGVRAAIPTTMAAGAATIGVSAKFLQLALFFLKVGATLFGSGYVLVSYLRGTQQLAVKDRPLA